MAAKEQSTSFALGNDDFTFLDHYVDPSWSSIAEQTQTGADENIFAGLPDFTKDSIFMEPLPFDLGSFVTSMSTENPSMSTKDIFAPIAPQAPVQGSIKPSATNLEPSLGSFSDSASPADSHSPSQSASAHADDIQSDTDEDSEDAEDDFIAPKRASAARGRGISAAVKSKRAANKAKPYPRVSDVVRDAPHKLIGADGKRQPASTELKGSVRTTDAADDDWRPTLEEYQRMSSKEKRQLRNKISARNFRVRRKEYITTLEGEVAIRDKQLETYREELSSTKSENSELRKEIDRLKREIMEGRGGGSIFDQPPADSKAVLAQVNGKATRNSVTSRRNKDLSSSGTRAGIWAHSTANTTTPVHTTLIPDFDISTLSGKPRLLQENLNPLLNVAFKRDSLTQANAAPNMPLLSSGLDGLHNFTLKGMDGDRMQLWSKMAREAGAAQVQREKLLASPASSTDSSAGSSSYSYISALSHNHVNPLFFSSALKKDNKIAATPTPTQAVLATSISQNISGKLMTALWGAFAPKSTLDLDKVKSVLEGKAELRVVDVDRSPAAVLEESLKAMSLSGTPSSPSAPVARKSSIDALEDGLKGMSLASTSAMKREGSSPVGLFGRPMRTGHSPTPAHQTNTKHTVTAQH
ncbi:hypothetical protein FRC14_003329 [Serendipita sp. 396]|nr:hypothetical protein FRC14_003329 [Serendipita sp. 396]KAG8783110.1 hypothetical protein FRC15_005792 [Serendipita sp. 397]KAG8800143.1 hypothetical protein FRC16_003530 [Serendipita sp. 398]KAG8821631.1 hypothetical protein FRC18_011273 [Serendipita sp. 400]KAG8828819.1 hypothetical protein FRC19_000207 [Serendipita sp. 401]KAG9058658.1 hypothetical protein FS842_005995 [Serendipita sp. 407]